MITKNLSLSSFSLNKSETVKVLTLAFGSIQYHYIRHVSTTFGIRNSTQSPDIAQNSDGGITDFRISSQSLTKGNCHISKTRYDIDMELGPVTEIDKRNKTTAKKLTMIFSMAMAIFILANCNAIVISQFFANLEQSGSRIPNA